MFRALRPAARRMQILGLCLVIAWLPPLGAQVGSDVAVVVHRDVPIDDLTVSELRRVVMGDREFWSGGVRITLLIGAPGSRVRDVVLKNLCQMSDAQFRQHWIAKVFRADAALAPKVVHSNEVSIDIVSRFPGAIAFIDAPLAGKGLKVMKIDGLVPGDKGYILH